MKRGKQIARTAKRYVSYTVMLITLSAFILVVTHYPETKDHLEVFIRYLISIQKSYPTITFIVFSLVYTVVVGCSLPVATLLTLCSGMLFGTVAGTLVVVISATLGALLAFSLFEQALRPWVSHIMATRLARFQGGFKKNAFHYCLFCRLAPIFPFWAVNMAMALLGMRKTPFVVSTLIGILPCSALYVYLGSTLKSLITTSSKLHLHSFARADIIIPLSVLALLSLIPLLHKKGEQT